MACNLDRESSDENEFSVNGRRIQPYMLEPEYSEEKLPRDEDKKAVSTQQSLPWLKRVTAAKYLPTGVDKYFAGVKVGVARKTRDVMQWQNRQEISKQLSQIFLLRFLLFVITTSCDVLHCYLL